MYDYDVSMMQDLVCMHSCIMDSLTQGASNLASYPGSRWAGKERAWYPLFAHALNFPEILGNRKLSCYIRTTMTT